MENIFSRAGMLIGTAGLERLARAHVAVVGVGGVGSYTAEALGRSGVGTITLIDSDTICTSNINRQLHALHSTLGLYKTQAMAARLRDINPDIDVRTKEIFCLPDNIAQVLDERYDYVIDAVDTVSAKLAIIAFCQQAGIPVISCMGAGNKLDPAGFVVADIYATSMCPLCRVMRRELKKLGVKAQKVVYSQEEPQKPDYTGFETPETGKKLPPGSIAFVPSVAGLIAAGEAVKSLLGMGMVK